MKARFHQRLLNHKPSIKMTIAMEPNSVTSGDQRRIRYEISIVRDVCALNGAIRKTGVNTVGTTATTSTNTISQTSLRLALVHSDNRVRRLGMPGPGSIFNLAPNHLAPKYADGTK